MSLDRIFALASSVSLRGFSGLSSSPASCAMLLVLSLVASRGLVAASTQTEILQAILDSHPDGTAGVYVKAVDGPAVVDVNKAVVFEPASAVKVLHLVHALRAVQDGQLQLSTEIPWCSDSVFIYEPRSGCPLPPCGESIELESALEMMMQNSDNRTTDAVATRFGIPALIDTAEELGMTDTALNHSIGCTGPIPNTLTLQDITSLYEEVAMGYLDATRRARMLDIMMSPDHLDDTVDEEADDLGVDGDALRYFKDNMAYAYKGGSYDKYGVFGAKFHRTFGGYASLPTADGGADEYVFGAFVNHANSAESADDRLKGLPPEMLRDQIRAALATFLPDPNGPTSFPVWDDRRIVSLTVLVWSDLLGRSRTTKADRSGQGRERKGVTSGQERKPTRYRGDTVEFVRADVNTDGHLDFADALLLLEFLFGDGGRPACLDAADVNDDGEVDLADTALLLAHLSGSANLPGGTTPGEYQTDPTPDRLGCAVGRPTL